jgi:hypothetical protein
LPWQGICVGDKNVFVIAKVARVVGFHGNGFVLEIKMWLP